VPIVIGVLVFVLWMVC